MLFRSPDSPGPSPSTHGPRDASACSGGPSGPSAPTGELTPTTSPGPSSAGPSASPPPHSPESAPSLDVAPIPPPEQPAPTRPITRRFTGNSRPKVWTDGTVAWLAACTAHGVADPVLEPASHHDALRVPCWREAMEAEIQALHDNETWSLVRSEERRVGKECLL